MSATTPFMFADDTKIVLKLNGLEDEKLLQDDIQALGNWSHDWNLQFSPSRCGLLRFWNDSTILYTMSNVEIVQNSSIKDLGIIISNDLSWSPHHRLIIAKAYKSLGLICWTFTTNLIEAKRQLYLSLVRSQIMYCSQIWRPYLVQDIILFEKIQ